MQSVPDLDMFLARKLRLIFNHFEAQKSYIKSRKKL
jgi:hypothetical protein